MDAKNMVNLTVPDTIWLKITRRKFKWEYNVHLTFSNDGIALRRYCITLIR